jgi:magnesium chelatase family protein
VLEARERVRSAIRASGFDFPNSRVTVNLAPAPVRKHGTGFDLPIALAVLAATGQVPRDVLGATAVGELGLDGTVRPVPGLLAHAITAARAGAALLVSGEAANAIAAATDCTVLSADRLSSLRCGIPPAARGRRPSTPDGGDVPDLAEVAGQGGAKRALEIAAAGGLGLLLIGSPGSAKTMLARRLPSILPPLSTQEALETAVIHSVAGLDIADVLSGVRPFRSPHHTATTAGLVGGGTPPHPGEASLAHNGVLFLDELPEFSPAALQALRQPLEDGYLTLVRAEGRVRYPARFALVAAMNPCPCGYLGDSARPCRCPVSIVERYRARIGGPLMDRIDMTLAVERTDTTRLLAGRSEESSTAVRARVETAIAFAGQRGRAADLSGSALLHACGLDEPARKAVESAARTHHLSGRGVTRLLRVARAIADLAQQPRVERDQVFEASAYRTAS